MAGKWEEVLQAMQALGLTVHQTPTAPLVPDQEDPDGQAFATFLNAATAQRFVTDPMKLPEARELLDRDKAGKVAMVLAGFEIVAQGHNVDYATSRAARALLTRLLRSRLDFTRPQILRLCSAWCRMDPVTRYELPSGSFVSAVERHLDGSLPMGPLRDLLKQMRVLHTAEQDSENLKLADRIGALVDNHLETAQTNVFVSGVWGDVAAAWLSADPQREAWTALLEYCKTATAGKPSQIWLRRAAPLVADVGGALVVDQLGRWSVEIPFGPPHGHGFSAAMSPGINTENADVVKGAIWAASALEDPRLPTLLADFAARCFHKIPDFGPGNAKLGNAAVVALSNLPRHAGVAGLSRLLGKVKYGSARKTIEKALDQAAAASGMSRDDLEELAVPDLGLSVDGVARLPVGDGFAVVRIENGETVELVYERDGSETKSPPKALADPEGVKAAKALKKAVTEALAGQAGRLERLLLVDKHWAVATWRDRYVQHPLLAQLARRLIWSVDGAAVLWVDGWTDAAGQPVAVPDAARVTLWHPLDHDAATVLSWRDRLDELGLVQPFKQAWREVYLVTPAELQTELYSNRFAAHVVRQHPFHALCRERGWAFTLMGQWDSHNTPTKPLPGGWTAELLVEPVEDASTPNGIYVLIATDQVRFSREGRAIPQGEVPARVFSEVMRDVDLFVAICSVAVDDAWFDRGPAEVQGYWNQYAFGELSEIGRTRHAALGRLIGRLKIGPQLRLEPTWLHVKGALRSYRIHLGSGSVQILPEQRYLCIVAAPSGAGKRVFLPFEGDRTLSLILSKAALLAADDQITDPAITRQF